MIARATFVLAALALVGCRDIAGVKAIQYVEGGSGGCTGAAPVKVVSSVSTFDSMFVQTGFVYVGVTSSGVQRCATSGCPSPTNVITAPATSTFQGFALGAAIVDYTLQSTAPDGGSSGELRSVGVDGTGDKSVLANLVSPSYVATSGAKTFWADDSFNLLAVPDSVNCVGCTGPGNAPWIKGFPGSIYALLADANTVYVLADEVSLTTLVLLACSVQTACASAPRTVIGSLDIGTTGSQLASDGTFAYVARTNHADVVRIDATGKLTQVMTSQDVTALAFDPLTGELYFGTSTGVVGHVKADGSTQPTSLVCSQPFISAVAVDDQSVYFLTGSTTSDVFKAPK